MKLLRTEDAVGQMLCHDITQIIRGVSKGPVFRKGHIITKEDIPVLKSVGKDHVYIWENDESMMHENDAAEVLCRMCRGDNIAGSEAREGKIELTAECDGLFKVDREKLRKVNSFGRMMIATRFGDMPVSKGDKLAGTRIIPLIIEKAVMEEAEKIAAGTPILKVLPFRKKRFGIVTTGNEVFHGRIRDTFTPVVIDKIKEAGGEVIGHELSDDDPEHIINGIKKLLSEGAEAIVCTGGMSVDPDDRTPFAIRCVADRVVTYGAPVLPGAMFMLAYLNDGNIPVMGLPGCVMYAKRTIFDMVLWRVMADDLMEKEDFDRLGEGGLCLACEVCTYPACGYGKGR